MEPSFYCRKCGAKYDIKEIYRNYGSDSHKQCWKCLKEWIDKSAADPYRAGAALMRNELPHHVREEVVAAYKKAFDLTTKMIQEPKKS